MSSPRGPQVAFLLAQIGAEAGNRFAAALAEIDLTPAQAGILRALGSQPGLSQQDLARRLQTAPSRIVGYLDDLQNRGVLQRTPGNDRRVNVITLTQAGKRLLDDVSRIARVHNDALTASLNPTQRAELRQSLTALADALGLTGSAHPGYHTAPDTSPGSARASRC